MGKLIFVEKLGSQDVRLTDPLDLRSLVTDTGSKHYKGLWSQGLGDRV